jgi:hypothetical protein
MTICSKEVDMTENERRTEADDDELMKAESEERREEVMKSPSEERQEELMEPEPAEERAG